MQVMFRRMDSTMNRTQMAWDPLDPSWVYVLGARGTSFYGFDVSKEKVRCPRSPLMAHAEQTASLHG